MIQELECFRYHVTVVFTFVRVGNLPRVQPLNWRVCIYSVKMRNVLSLTRYLYIMYTTTSHEQRNVQTSMPQITHKQVRLPEL